MRTRNVLGAALAAVGMLTAATPAQASTTTSGTAAIAPVPCTDDTLQLTGTLNTSYCFAGTGFASTSTAAIVHISAGRWGGQVQAADNTGCLLPPVFFHPGEELAVSLPSVFYVEINEEA